MYAQTNQFSALSSSARYTSGQATKVFVSEPYNLNGRTPSQQLTLANSVAIGDSFVNVSAGCTKILYEGTRLNFGTELFPKVVFVSAEVPAYATTIPIRPATVPISAGAIVKLEAYIPLFSAKSANSDNQTQTYNDQNFSSYTACTAPNGISSQGSISGAAVHNDPGHKLLKKAEKNGQICKIEIIDDLASGGSYAEAHFGVNKQRSNNQYNQVTYSIFPIRSWSDYSAFNTAIDSETYILTFIDTNSLGADEVRNINATIPLLRKYLSEDLYSNPADATKYIKDPVTYTHGQYLYLPWEADYRDGVGEPEKYLFLIFQNDADPAYHATPRDVLSEPLAQWTTDYNGFVTRYASFESFYGVVFSPTADPSSAGEDAFNSHIIDAVNGNNGYSALSDYNWAAKPYWKQGATHTDIYGTVIDFIKKPQRLISFV